MSKKVKIISIITIALIGCIIFFTLLFKGVLIVDNRTYMYYRGISIYLDSDQEPLDTTKRVYLFPGEYTITVKGEPLQEEKQYRINIKPFNKTILEITDLNIKNEELDGVVLPNKIGRVELIESLPVNADFGTINHDKKSDKIIIILNSNYQKKDAIDWMQQEFGYIYQEDDVLWK